MIYYRVENSLRECLGGDPRGSRVVLLASGGMDSAVMLKILEMLGVDVYVVTINLRSRAPRELEAMRSMLSAVSCVRAHHEIEARDLLEAVEIADAYRSLQGREPYYVPARNVVFVGYAAHYAEIHGARAIVTAHNAWDKEALPDASERFQGIVNELLKLYGDLRLCMPFSGLGKDEVALLGLAIGAPVELSWSCYDWRPRPCGKCRGCLERERALETAKRFLEEGRGLRTSLPGRGAGSVGERPAESPAPPKA